MSERVPRSENCVKVYHTVGNIDRKAQCVKVYPTVRNIDQGAQCVKVYPTVGNTDHEAHCVTVIDCRLQVDLIYNVFLLCCYLQQFSHKPTYFSPVPSNCSASNPSTYLFKMDVS